MSTILKALKRLETEQSPQPEIGFEKVGPSNARKAIGRQSAFSLFRIRLTAVAVVAFVALAAVLAFLGWIALQSKQGNDDLGTWSKQEDMPKGPIASQNRVLPSSPVSGTKPQTGISINNHSRVSTHTASRPGRPQERSEEAHPAVRQDPPSVQASIAPPTVDGPPQTLRTESSQQPSSRGDAQTRAKSPNLPEVGDDPYEDAQRLTDGRLKVQAIVWAPEPSDRMAVVNNSIVREGGGIEGFFVVGIGREAVYVREDGRLLKVPFGTP